MKKKLILLSICTFIFTMYSSENSQLKMHTNVSVYSVQNKRNHQEDFFYHGIVDGGKLYAIYDGHGGTFAAGFLQRNFPTYFLAASGDTMRKKMKATCQKLEEDLITYLQTKERVEDQSKYGSCGSTLVATFVKDGLAYFMHVGDSRAVLESEGKVVFATADHKVGNKDEFQRIKELKADGFIHLYANGARIGGLAISRAFGDYTLKNKLKNECKGPVIIAEPDYMAQHLTKQNKFLVLASDGLWDTLTNEKVIQILNDKKDDDIDSITQLLATTAIEKGSTDNITVMLVDLLS